MKKIGVVIPCHNEELVLSETTRRLGILFQGLSAKGKISFESKVYFVDDGSQDKTWNIIRDAAANHPFVEGIKLSRNRGHQSAVLAGLMHAEGDCLISIDADLQDDLSAIEEMVDAHVAGSDIVYGVRKARNSDTPFKRFSAELYYRILAMMGVEIIFNHADFRLMSRRAIDALREFGEVNLFLRGIIPQLGFNSAIVHYDRVERFAGESKYPLSKMLSLAVQGITSFSVFPLRIIATVGLLISVLSFAIGLWALWLRLFTQQAIPGWASTVLPMYLLGGIQLFSLGVIGEYLGKIYLEIKRRPRYFIEEFISHESPRPPGQ